TVDDGRHQAGDGPVVVVGDGVGHEGADPGDVAGRVEATPTDELTHLVLEQHRCLVHAVSHPPWADRIEVNLEAKRRGVSPSQAICGQPPGEAGRGPGSPPGSRSCCARPRRGSPHTPFTAPRALPAHSRGPTHDRYPGRTPAFAG